MATAINATQMSNRFAPGSSWSAMNNPPRAPSGAGPSTYGAPTYPVSGRNGGYSYNPNQPPIRSPAMSTTSPPEVHVVSPSVEGEEDWDDEQSIYSTRTSNYYPEVYKSNGRASGQQSMYSTSTSGQSLEFRDSWQTNGTARPDSNVDPFAFRNYETRTQLPRVIVSSPSEASFRRQSGATTNSDDARASEIPAIPKAVTPPPIVQVQGRVPSAVQGTRNFSRPNRPPISSPPSEDGKKEVLERNQRRWQGGDGSPQQKTQPRSSPVPYSTAVSLPQIITPNSSSASNEDVYGGMQDDGDEHLGSEYVAVPRPAPNKLVYVSPAQPRTPSPSGLSPTSPQGLPPLLTHSSSLSSTSSGHSSHAPQTPQGLVPLPTHPPNMRASTPDSLYSNYSYYPLDGNTPPASATLSSFPSASSQALRTPDSGSFKQQLQKMPSSQDLRDKTPKVKSPIPHGTPANPQTAEEYLALGISHHEADRLSESARCFEQAATLNGGCAVGMLMWGLALRHGWGVPKDEPRAFKWLKRAAEHAVVDLQEGSGKYAREAVKVCFRPQLHFYDTFAHPVATRKNLFLRSMKWANASFGDGVCPRIKRWV